MIKLKQSDILSLIKDEYKGSMTIGGLTPSDFRSEKYITSTAHYIFALSTQIDISSKRYQNLLQFFILSLNDCITKNNDTSNATAFYYAVNYLNDNIDEAKLQEVYKQTTSSLFPLSSRESPRPEGRGFFFF